MGFVHVTEPFHGRELNTRARFWWPGTGPRGHRGMTVRGSGLAFATSDPHCPLAGEAVVQDRGAGDRLGLCQASLGHALLGQAPSPVTGGAGLSDAWGLCVLAAPALANRDLVCGPVTTEGFQDA